MPSDTQKQTTCIPIITLLKQICLKEHSSSPSDDNPEDGSFTMVSYHRTSNNSSRTAYARRKNKNSHTETSHSGTMTMASLTQFKQFQQDIFPIIEFIAHDPKHRNHPVIKEWLAAKTTHNISSNSTFHTVSKGLGLKDLNHYRVFIEEIPYIKSYLTIQLGIGKTSFQYDIHHIQDITLHKGRNYNTDDTTPNNVMESKTMINDNDSITTKNSNADNSLMDTTWNT
jgi:hypothetical protein